MNAQMYFRSYFYYSFYQVSLARQLCVVTEVLFPLSSSIGLLPSFLIPQEKSQMKCLCTKNAEKITMQLKPCLFLHMPYAWRAHNRLLANADSILLIASHFAWKTAQALQHKPKAHFYVALWLHINIGSTASSGTLSGNNSSALQCLK